MSFQLLWSLGLPSASTGDIEFGRPSLAARRLLRRRRRRALRLAAARQEEELDESLLKLSR